MPTEVRITSVEFNNFKAFQRFSIRLSTLSILVGPNNCGKSTAISAFRVLESALRRAKSKSPERIIGSGRLNIGYRLAEDSVPMSVENVHSEYSEEDSTVVFRLDNGSKLTLNFPADGGVFLTAETSEGTSPRSPTAFREAFPITVAAVPILGPLEHDEDFVERNTVVAGLSTHRASRHFRNYWHYFPDGFEQFASLVRDTWPGMEIKPPEAPDYGSKTITMFCTEDRIARELYWAGFGFQVWCQLLTHITRSANATLLLVDEPEIYLHPDVQRQLVDLLRHIGPDILVATHSSEIISEAEPSEIMLVDKRNTSAKRLSDVGEVQAALHLIGSIQNITLTQLARTRKVVFVEDESDFALLRRFATVLGYQELASGIGLTAVKSEGFGSWERIRSVGWGIERTLGSPLHIAAIYDRDFHCDEEIDLVTAKLREHLPLVHIHHRKEIENYLLEPEVIHRAVTTLVRDRTRRDSKDVLPSIDAVSLIDEACADQKPMLLAHYASEKYIFLRSTGIENSTVIEETSRWLDYIWGDVSERAKIVSGKDALRRLRAIVQDRYKVTLTSARIMGAFLARMVPSEIAALVAKLEEFRVSAL